MFDFFKKKPRGSDGPDFSDVDTAEKVQQLVRAGRLDKVLLLPEAFGGADIEVNVVYLPAGMGAIKARTDHNVVLPLAQEGKVTRYTATPTYAGKSRVPTSLLITAKDPGDFSVTLRCWGEGLKSDA